MKIITQKELASLAEDAFKNAEKHGFYNESTEIETTLMLISRKCQKLFRQTAKIVTEVSKTMRARFRWAEIFLPPTKTLLKERLNPSSLILPSVSYPS